MLLNWDDGYLKSARQWVQEVLRGLGYEVRRRGVSVEFEAVATVKEKEYYHQWFSPYPLFSPWVGHPEFQTYYEGVAPFTLVTPDRLYMLLGFARHARHLAGDFVECGVFKGGTALLLARVIKDSNKKLHLFDSFKGLSKKDPEHDNYWGEGSFSNESLDSVRELLKDYHSLVAIHVGWIPNTFADLRENRYAFIHVDVDLYRPTLDCCGYFYSRLVPGGVMIFDDYGFPACRGEKDAVDEFFANKPEKPITLPTGQALVIKT